MIEGNHHYDPKDLDDLQNTIVDAPGSGLTKCPFCGYHSVDEEGWCYNGCMKERGL